MASDRSTRAPGVRLEAAINDLMTPHGEIRAHRATSWASITFSGSRHMMQLHFEGAEAVDYGNDMLTALPDRDFVIPGAIVADVAITQSDWHAGPQPTLSASIEVLMLDEAA